jgi:hypothetical protein
MLAIASMKKLSTYLDRYPKKYLWLATIFVGTLARIVIARLGHNQDFNSWTINAAVLRDGGSVYSGDVPYGYGPFWMFVLRFADLIQNLFPDNRKIFRLVIILILTLADLLIAAIIARKFSHYAALLFFLNPISIIISGYHNQFDNIAILAALVAVMYFDSEPSESKSRNLYLGLALIGLSLAVKQILLFFPVWLFFRNGTFKQRVTRGAMPYVVYIACFIPWATSIARIEIIFEEIFLQRRGRSGILLNLFGADWAGTIEGSIYSDLIRKVVFASWVLGVLAFGWIMRNRSLFHSLIVYLLLMVGLAPAFSQQQLILPLIALFVYATIELKIFYLLTLLFMIQNSDELGYEFLFPHFFRLNGTIYAWLQVLLLVFALRLVFPNHPQNLKSRHLQTALKLD